MTKRPSARRSKPARSAKRAGPRSRRPQPGIAVTVRQIEALRGELRQRTRPVPRWNADPDDVQRSVARLVLSLVEVLRQLMERQAIRRMDAGTLSAEEVEALGQALMRLEETIRDIAARFDLAPEDLNLDLGPIGRLT